MQRTQLGGVHAGDGVIAEGHRVDATVRVGDVVEVPGEPAHERCRIRWHGRRETLA